jgi:uncharacterized protein YggE
MAAILVVPVTHAIAEPAGELPRVIRVSGEGTATASPDMATIHTGVVSQAATARETLDQNNAAMQKILAAIREHDIADKDVQTSDFSLNPVYKQAPPGNVPIEPEVVAYRAQNQVRVRVRNLASLGKVLDALVQAGSNQLSGISFGVDDPSGILNQARSRAIRDAKARADVYAQAADVAVGPVWQISEQPVDGPRPLHAGVEFRASAAGVPVATGEQEFRVTVNVVYTLQ